MVCKSCGHELPKVGYNCTNCGTMMSLEQIKKQKEESKDLNLIPEGLVSERYGHKDFIYKKREEVKPRYKVFLLFLGILLILFLVVIFVYL